MWRKLLICMCLFFVANILFYFHFMLNTRNRRNLQYNISHFQHIPDPLQLENPELENIAQVTSNFFSLKKADINELSIDWKTVKQKMWQFIKDFNDNSSQISVEVLLNSFLPVNVTRKFLFALYDNTKENITKNYMYNNQFIINEPNICSRKKIDLIIVVFSGISHFDERNAIRETWGNYTNDRADSVQLVFLLGNTIDNEMNRKIFAESLKHHDIIQKDFIDSYRNLTLKSIAMIKWVSEFCNNSRFVLKCDDDMYVNTKNLLTMMKSKTTKMFLIGYVFNGARPVQDIRSKWYTPKKDFLEKVYPQYCSGTAYALTTNAAHKLYKASLQIRPFWLEDIYITGLCARLADIPRLHDWGFSFVSRKPTGCQYQKSITGHNVPIKDMHVIYKELTDPHLKC